MLHINQVPISYHGYERVIKYKTEVNSIGQFSNELARKGLLPHYFGGGLDAINDVLWHWLFDGVKSVAFNFEEGLSTENSECKKLLHILFDHGYYWGEEGGLFSVYLCDESGESKNLISNFKKPASKKQREQNRRQIERSIIID